MRVGPIFDLFLFKFISGKVSHESHSWNLGIREKWHNFTFSIEFDSQKTSIQIMPNPAWKVLFFFCHTVTFWHSDKVCQFSFEYLQVHELSTKENNENRVSRTVSLVQDQNTKFKARVLRSDVLQVFSYRRRFRKKFAWNRRQKALSAFTPFDLWPKTHFLHFAANFRPRSNERSTLSEPPTIFSSFFARTQPLTLSSRPRWRFSRTQKLCSALCSLLSASLLFFDIVVFQSTVHKFFMARFASKNDKFILSSLR